MSIVFPLPNFYIKTSFKPKPTQPFLLTWPNIKLGTLCLYKNKDDKHRHTFSKSDSFQNVKRICRNRGDLPQILSAMKNSFQGWEWELASPDKKPEKHQLSKNFRGQYLRKKIGFPGMITSVSCVTDKVTLKLPRQSSILGEKREHASRKVPAVFFIVLKSIGSCQVRLFLWAFVSSGDLLNKHSYTGPKLGHKVSNSLDCKFFW